MACGELSPRESGYNYAGMRHDNVIKKSGERESFSHEKLLRSLMSSGASRQEAEEIIERVLREVPPPLSTRRMFRAARKYLRKTDGVSQMLYSMKEAIRALGPTGFPFERYIGRILMNRGYAVEVGIMVQGRCVSHEVDVVARKGNVCYMVECKFHHNGDNHSGVQTALYVQSRFEDIKEALRALHPEQNLVFKGMLITNTRFSSEALKYAQCIGLQAVGWRTPEGGETLERMVKEDSLYPVTILPGLKRIEIAALLRHDVILVRELIERGEKFLTSAVGLKERHARQVLEKATRLCCPVR